MSWQTIMTKLNEFYDNYPRTTAVAIGFIAGYVIGNIS